MFRIITKKNGDDDEIEHVPRVAQVRAFVERKAQGEDLDDHFKRKDDRND